MIVMMEDVTETVEISEGKEITLNVNGNILSSDTASTATITNYGTLTLVDTTNCGVITRGETQFYTIVNEGNMTLDGVTVENTTDGVSSLIINNLMFLRQIRRSW